MEPSQWPRSRAPRLLECWSSAHIDISSNISVSTMGKGEVEYYRHEASSPTQQSLESSNLTPLDKRMP